MIYQVRANLYFTNQGIAQGLYNHIIGVFPDATLINPDQENIEFSILELINNNHDQDPNQPCELIEATSNEP